MRGGLEISIIGNHNVLQGTVKLEFFSVGRWRMNLHPFLLRHEYRGEVSNGIRLFVVLLNLNSVFGRSFVLDLCRYSLYY